MPRLGVPRIKELDVKQVAKSSRLTSHGRVEGDKGLVTRFAG